MPALPLQIMSLVADFMIFGLVVYYFIRLRNQEKELRKKETRIDTNYHQIVDDALSKERKIIDDATAEADQIIGDAKHINQGVRDEVNQALQMLVADIQKRAYEAAQDFTANYQLSLKDLSQTSLRQFQDIARSLQSDLQNQVKEFHTSLLPNLEKQLEEYKKSRLDQTEKIVTKIIERASQELINKSISLEDHKDLVRQSLEKAKKESVFD
jgi:hypothetical protein